MSTAIADRDGLVRRLDKLRRCGAAVGWGTLLVGLHGFGWVDRQVSAANAIAIALDALEQNPDDDLVLVLACLRESETGDVVAALERLADREGTDQELERRKWRLLLLEERMETLPADPLYGLLDLDEFWRMFDYPEDAARTAQTRSGVTPEQYYTRDNYEAEVARHKRWMEQEAMLLRRAAVDSRATLPCVP